MRIRDPKSAVQPAQKPGVAEPPNRRRSHLWRPLVRVGALAFVLSGTLPASAKPVTIYNDNFKGTGSQATFRHDDGCVFAVTNLFANDGQLTNTVNGHVGVLTAEIYDGAYNYCTGETLKYRYGEVDLAVGDFAIDRGLASARLKATIPAYDSVNGVIVQLAVDMSWTATSGAVKTNTRWHRTYPDGSKEDYHSSGSESPASAAGTVSDGGANITPGPTLDATLFSSKEAQHTLTR